MPIAYQAATLQMEWCLECHRYPEKYLRPVNKVFDMTWRPPDDQIAQGMQLKKDLKVQDAYVLTSCSTCHR
jgi:hypothetical protein